MLNDASVILLDKSFHKKAHRQLEFDYESLCFKYNDELLDTKEKHISYLINRSDELKLDVEIKSFEL